MLFSALNPSSTETYALPDILFYETTDILQKSRPRIHRSAPLYIPLTPPSKNKEAKNLHLPLPAILSHQLMHKDSPPVCESHILSSDVPNPEKLPFFPHRVCPVMVETYSLENSCHSPQSQTKTCAVSFPLFSTPSHRSRIQGCYPTLPTERCKRAHLKSSDSSLHSPTETLFSQQSAHSCPRVPCFPTSNSRNFSFLPPYSLTGVPEVPHQSL